MTKLRIVFLGTPQIGLKSLEHLYNSQNFEIVGIVTQPDKPAGRGKKITESAIKKFALNNNIPLFQPISIRKDFDVIESLKKLSPDFFVTFAFGQILSQEVLDIPKYETINLHVSLLPKYRGANPIQRAIINGDKETGICTMITELGLDCGDICLKKPIEITPDMTCMELFEICATKSPELLEKTLIGLANKTLIPEPQCNDGVCYANKLSKDECLIDWNNSAEDIHNLVRGIYKCPGAYFIYQEKIIKVMETTVVDKEKTGPNGKFINISKNGIDVQTGKGIIRLIKIKPEGKGEMNAFDWSNGLKKS